MKNNFKAVMIDLDGTLLTDDKKLLLQQEEVYPELSN